MSMPDATQILAVEVRRLGPRLDSDSRTVESSRPSVRLVSHRICHADECDSLLQEIIDRISPRFGKSLAKGGSGKPVYDGGRSLFFQTQEQNRVQEFRDRLARQVALLDLLSGPHALTRAIVQVPSNPL
ncbi:hypothetical protein QBC47DRAFT_165736 [Echria macrotheca]|uniref:Uncharacterized protein n=1 Tax=Echria macrotheca TaxID=438768 RepID=A0AAJ0BGH5_9PEZI|nr:hypothetical protein QBC47DRAFT_165736 [Echria macrotheca]